MSVLSQILEHKIVAIFHGMPPIEIMCIADALYTGGIRILEITLNSPDALLVIEKLSHAFKDMMIIGARTVPDTKDAANAIDAGAKFVISPSLDLAGIKSTKDAGVVSISDAFTPTEILSAHNNDADIVKVFPCLNAAYIKNILAPLNHIRIMPIAAFVHQILKQLGQRVKRIGGEEGTNGLAGNKAGQLLLCQSGKRQVVRLNAPLDTPKPDFTILSANCNGKQFYIPNDLVADSKCHIYFADSFYGLPQWASDSKRELIS
ncbi:hypothetical protein BH10BAC2_BH10BAC2_46820 [soil metagenome]